MRVAGGPSIRRWEGGGVEKELILERKYRRKRDSSTISRLEQEVGCSKGLLESERNAMSEKASESIKEIEQRMTELMERRIAVAIGGGENPCCGSSFASGRVSMDWIDEAIDILVDSLCERLKNLRELVRIRRQGGLTDITNLAHEIDQITRVLGRAEAQRNTDREDGHQAIEEVAPQRGVVRHREEVEEDGAKQDMEAEYERFRKRIRRSFRKMR
ncbi:hypothetical protein BSKO_06880 [Bryopsis sp. KO-2023]|nr:hypothetical protein BSKO_06880 [Bryopsis sp. KO-2023]